MSRFGSTDAPPVGDRESMLDVLQGFIHELRAAGLPVSMTENLDAMRAVEHVDIAERDTFKAALGATLVKHHHHWRAFETVFDVYFSLYASGIGEDGEDGAPSDLESMEGMRAQGGGAMGDVSPEELAQMLLQALINMDRDQLRQLAGVAVDRFAGMEPGRPVGGTYYLYRTLRQLDGRLRLRRSSLGNRRHAWAGDDARSRRTSGGGFRDRFGNSGGLLFRSRAVSD